MAVPTQEMITEWRLDMKGNAKKIQDFVKEMKAAERTEKAVDHATKRLSGEIDSMGRKVGAAKTKVVALASAQDKLNKTSSKLAGTLKTALRGAVVGIGAAIVGAGAAMVGLIGRGVELNALWAASEIDISRARDATKGFISDQELLKASNKSTAFQLGFTNEQFAELAKGAVVASKKIGGDTSKAIDDLMTGLSRLSKPILDNLGIQVDAAKASDTYAKSIGTVSSALTEQEKKQAFINAALADLNRLAGDAEIKIDSLGGAYTAVGTAADNATGAAGRFLSSLVFGTPTLSAFADKLNEAAEAMNKMSDPRRRKMMEISGQITEMTGKMIELRKEVDFTDRSFIKGESFFRTKSKLAAALSFYNQYTAKQREFTKLRVSIEDEAQKKEHDAFIAGQNKIAKAQIAAFEAQELLKKTAKAKSPKKVTVKDAELKFEKYSPSESGPSENFISNIIKAETASAKVAANVKAAMTAATSVPISNIPLARIFDEEMFLKLQAGNAEFASIKTKMDAMAATGDVASAAYMKLAAQLNKVGAATVSAANKVTAFRTSVNETTADVVDMGIGAFSSFASSLWSVADAAIQSGDSFAAAIAKALKASLLALAAEATAKAIFSLAEYALSGFTDASKLVAAGLYGAVAIAAGAAGLGMSAATASSSGSTTAQSNTTTGTQQFGQTVEDKRPVNINVFFNDPYDPSSAFVRSRSISTAIGRQQTVSS